jgi:drug/metabolite transporter (DMT)-like permease
MNGPGENRLRGDLWAVVSALATGGGLVIAKIALQSINPITMNTYVFFTGSVIILIDAAISGKLKEMIAIKPAQLLFLFMIAMFFAGSTFCLFTAISFSEPATVSFLSRLELVATLILAAIFLKERINPAEISGLVLVVAGIIVMRYGASIELSRAVGLVSFAALLFGTAEVLIKSRIDWINYRSFIFYRGIFMSAIFIVIGLVTGRIIWVTDGNLILILIAAAFFLPYLGRLGYLKAMKHIDISRASIIVQSQPFFAAAVALAILGTFPPLKEVIGGLLIVTGVITIKLLERRRMAHSLAED